MSLSYQTKNSSPSPAEQVYSEILRRQLLRRDLLPSKPSRSTFEAPPTPTLEAYWKARYPNYQYAQHVALLIHTLEQLRAGDALIINMPPRHGKSESVKAYIEWYMGQHPDHSVMYGSYSARLAYRQSRAVRNEILTGGAFPRAFPQVQLARDERSKAQWQTSAEGGFLPAGVGGSITGFGAHLAVIDDPIKGRKQAESPVVRQGVIDWFKNDLYTRLAPDSILIVIQTRWHTEDLTGWLLENMEDEDFSDLNWKTLELPALAEPTREKPDPMGRAAGAALWPDRWSAAKLEKTRRVLGDYDFSALYQQCPTVKGGTIFLESVTRYEVPASEGRTVVFADTASSKRETADYSAFSVWRSYLEKGEMCADLLEVVHGRFSITEFGAQARRLQEQYGVPIHVEKNGVGLPITQYLTSVDLNVIPVTVEGDKYTRSLPYSAAWNTGRIRLPRAAPWLSSWMTEHLAFTGTDADGHDDQVDSGSGAWRVMAGPVEETVVTTLRRRSVAL